jgi:hypothetical protein
MRGRGSAALAEGAVEGGQFGGQYL